MLSGMDNRTSSLPPAPICPRIDRTFNEFGETRVDPYFWLREKENPAVRTYVEAENAYAETASAPYADRKAEIFERLKGLVEPEAYTPPYPVGDTYLYGSRTPEGAEYAVHFRKRGDAGPEEIILDENELAKGVEHCDLGAFEVSNDDRLLAYSIDSDGSEHYAIFVKNLATGETHATQIPNSSGEVIFSADGSVLFYTKVNEFDRPDRVYRHRLKSDLPDGTGDELVYLEKDSRFFVDVSITSDGETITIGTHSKESSEFHLIPARSPLSKPTLFAPRRDRHSYTLERFRGEYLVLSNRRERNYDLFRVAGPGVSERDWISLRQGDERTDLRDIEAFEKFFALRYAVGGEHRVDLIDSDWNVLRTITMDEPYSALDLGANLSYRREWVRFTSRSMRKLPEIFEVNAFTGERRLLHRTNLPNYDETLYAVTRFEAPGEDGTLIPVAALYRKDLYQEGKPMPTILYGYGAYGYPNDARFSASQILACDLGFLWASAQIRGGGDLGQRWYDEGKFLKKANTFRDFRDCARALIDRGFAKKGDVSIYGGSAGGLLVTATMELEPELFRSVVALVPFVDVLNTMLDETLPLTPGEFDEWGNPKEEEYYRAIRAYSPYDTLRARAYPHLLMICGWNDPRVTYWEPAKYVAKMRTLNESDSLTLLKTHFGSGHGGASGRFEHLKDPAEILAFLEYVHRA